MRGRRRVDCIGRMGMRPSDLEIASQSHLKIFESLLNLHDLRRATVFERNAIT